MFIIGTLIFIAYMFGLCTMINRSHKEQERDLDAYTKVDEVDLDGMGNFSRFRSKKVLEDEKLN